MNEARKKQIANVREAMKMWETVPPENVAPRLGDWRNDGYIRPPTCGTLACFGGWCAWWPEFRRRGVRAGHGGAPVLSGTADSMALADHMFGHEGMFEVRNGHPDDYLLLKTATDHEVVMHRLQRQLAKLEAMRGE